MNMYAGTKMAISSLFNRQDREAHRLERISCPSFGRKRRRKTYAYQTRIEFSTSEQARIDTPPELAVGDGLESDIPLPLHDVRDSDILGVPELVGGALGLVKLVALLEEGGGALEGAKMLGAVGWVEKQRHGVSDVRGGKFAAAAESF